MGSIAAAAWIARLAFVALLAIGVGRGDLGSRAAAVFVVLGVVAAFGLPLLPGGGGFVTAALAVIDIALVFAVFKGDVRL